MNITGDIEFCYGCENPDTKLEPDDFDMCKKCQLEECRAYIKSLDNYGKIMVEVLKKHNLVEEFQAEIWKRHNQKVASK
jgi:hypothetical protein